MPAQYVDLSIDDVTATVETRRRCRVWSDDGDRCVEHEAPEWFNAVRLRGAATNRLGATRTARLGAAFNAVRLRGAATNRGTLPSADYLINVYHDGTPLIRPGAVNEVGDIIRFGALRPGGVHVFDIRVVGPSIARNGTHPLVIALEHDRRAAYVGAPTLAAIPVVPYVPHPSHRLNYPDANRANNALLLLVTVRVSAP